MTRDGGRIASGRVAIDRVPCAFSDEKTTLLQNVAHELAPFHVIDSDLDRNKFALGFAGPLPLSQFPIGFKD